MEGRLINQHPWSDIDRSGYRERSRRFSLEVLKLRNVNVEIERLRVTERCAVTDSKACDCIPHGHLHLLPTDSILKQQ